MSKALKVFVIAIAAMGVLRFILTVSGLPNNVVKYFSMSAIMIVGLIYFAVVTSSHKERLKVSYLLVMPYMTVKFSRSGTRGHQAARQSFTRANIRWAALFACTRSDISLVA